jgi:hypothetical protein
MLPPAMLLPLLALLTQIPNSLLTGSYVVATAEQGHGGRRNRRRQSDEHKEFR